MAVNSQERDYCCSCGGEDFDDLNLTPLWDSFIPYLEEPTLPPEVS